MADASATMMKLRLRSVESNQTHRIEVPPRSTLQQLQETLSQSISSSSSSSLHISLNRKDELQGYSPEASLHSLGITSGDLLYFTFDPAGSSSPIQTQVSKRLISIETMSSSKKITLKSSDGVLFQVDEAVALVSQTIKDMIENGCAIEDGIPLPNVTSKILEKVIAYCKVHVGAANSEDRTSEDDLKAWDADFVWVDKATLFHLILAANYLNIKSLLDLTTQTAADIIKGKTAEGIREFFNMESDATAEEQEVNRLAEIRLQEEKIFLQNIFFYKMKDIVYGSASVLVAASLQTKLGFSSILL
ncbi:SKP1-like protein 1A isoform X2 [Carya illinoinensis]|uniref:Uncharacterized protein n=1 Tax=Carya illinoinensis TaxID=32201 RepID=A0A8T1PUN2_CARIL|nr:SKP1-like protein 1A isoform X2 [Carya illinoinensis]XP_042939746.1 SKP1-like protein 1A isoform X2 [Carya illinoinensis]XP_042939747.1 SKP1-like protein 1A isoform X2 [Carya illinoinensis]KAG6645524.1 hypothetical protein CIPAW_08G128300 [Carya illinoinensis]KAG6645525.1 hypothetical protein CIPAW_08G128300 [Carya illinoinensis]KAG6700755.1 hypothetical protein I3842_08G129000 [Carya illinoinensis]KAG6700756.1 hypothetical protein I3842_08G129000 [Carya illinoinensis]